MGVLSKRPSLSQGLCLPWVERSRDPGKLVRVIARSAAARIAASVVLAGALLVGTTGCTFIATQATLIQYDPSDGIGATVGTIDIRNAFALINEDEDAVSLVLTFVNTNDRSANMKLQFESAGEKVTVTKPLDGNAVTTYGTTPEETQIVVTEPGVKAGELFPVYFQYGDNEGVELLLPVLTADNDAHYEDLLPR